MLISKTTVQVGTEGRVIIGIEWQVIVSNNYKPDAKCVFNYLISN